MSVGLVHKGGSTVIIVKEGVVGEVCGGIVVGYWFIITNGLFYTTITVNTINSLNTANSL